MRFDLAEGIAVLERTPRVLRTLLAGLPDGFTRATEGPDTWSPFDVVGHLIHGERTDWMARLELILSAGETRPFTPFDRFAQFEASRGKSLGVLLDTFQALREDNLARLASLRLSLPTSAAADAIPSSARSPSASCSRPGSRMISVTWVKSRGSWGRSTPRPWAPGWRTCRCSATGGRPPDGRP